MNNEMLEKVKMCKSVDELKNLFGSKKALKDEELEQVAGGRLFFLGQPLNTKEDVSDICSGILKQMEEQFGREALAGFIASEFQDPDAVKKYNASGLNGLCNYLCVNLVKRT